MFLDVVLAVFQKLYNINDGHIPMEQMLQIVKKPIFTSWLWVWRMDPWWLDIKANKSNLFNI